MPILASEGCFWPLTASMTSEAKINYAHVTTQGICNNFIEVNFCMGPMVSEPNRLFQHSTTMSLINKITSYIGLSLYYLSRARRELVLKTFRQQLFRGIIRLKSHLYSKSVGRFRSSQLTIRIWFFLQLLYFKSVM
jgi:hypothetical protein